MTLWMVRAGRNGEQEDEALDQGLAVIGWDEVPNLDQVHSKDELRDIYTELDPEQSIRRINNHVNQLWAFSKRVEEGDLITIPGRVVDTLRTWSVPLLVVSSMVA